MAKRVLLDTGVLIKLRWKKHWDAMYNFLAKNFKNYEFFISSITKYEFIRTAKNREDLAKKVKLLEDFTSIEVSDQIINVSSYYYNAIGKNTSDKKHSMKQFSDSDIIIWATAIDFKIPVCTFNGSDFPRPFFDESLVEIIANQKFYVLKPDQNAYEKEVIKIGL